LKLVKSVGDSLTVGLESTDTYGEAMRQGLTEEGIEVHRISGKATYDYQEIFDGVPSQHDGKDAAVIAELTAYGKGAAWPWQADSELLASVKHQVFRAEAYRGQQSQWSGRPAMLDQRGWRKWRPIRCWRIARSNRRRANSKPCWQPSRLGRGTPRSARRRWQRFEPTREIHGITTAAAHS
jgi:hypothetical protein